MHPNNLHRIKPRQSHIKKKKKRGKILFKLQCNVSSYRNSPVNQLELFYWWGLGIVFLLFLCEKNLQFQKMAKSSSGSLRHFSNAQCGH